jgi:hypothetical protein
MDCFAGAGASRERGARQQEEQNCAAAHPAGCEERRGAEQAAGYRHDRSRRCDAQHPAGSAAQEGRQQGGHRFRLPGVLSERVDGRRIEDMLHAVFWECFASC